ncbi:prolyl oligopeptidase family serine peptidase [Aquabacterium sp.]|uniref:carboxylesterase family protein n=1 Tax=Aquabacterium sp. TaxID=1872578 RepID=UPI00378346EA
MKRRAFNAGLAPGAALPLVATARAQAQPRAETGFIDHSLVQGGQTWRYQVYVPADYASRKDWPVTLFLHGSGERGTDGQRASLVGLGAAIRWNPQRHPGLAVFPQARPDTSWSGEQAEMALAALRQTLADYHTDPRRVYLTGLSMGGHGSWWLAYRHPQLFAAVLPVCGWLLPMAEWPAPVVPPADGPAAAAVARRLSALPLWIFHGEMDDAVPPEDDRAAFAALQAAGAAARYTEYLGLGHNCWDATYGSETVLRWMFAQRRPA